MVYLIVFILGLVIGSFLNVVVYREVREIEAEKTSDKSKHSLKIISFLPSWLLGRSVCDHCLKPISWYDNIPLLSFLCLKGRCRHCHKKITCQYPLFEFLTGVEFIWLYWLLSNFAFFGQLEGIYSLALAGYWFFIFSVSLVILLVDLKTKIIPDIVLLPAIAVSILRLFFNHQWLFLIAGLLTSVFFLSLFLITKGKGMGFGDVKLAFFVGLILGWWQRILVAVFLAFLTGALVGIIVMVAGKKTWKQALPFAPFLLFGMWIAKLWGDQIWSWYWSLMR